MGGNRSLDEFFGRDDDTGEADGADRDGTGADELDPDGTVEADEVRPGDTDDAVESGTGDDSAGEDSAGDGATDAETTDPETVDGETTGAEPIASGSTPASGSVAPATPTYRVVDDGECEACGAATTRLWRDDEAYVCRDCKEW